MVIFTEEMLNAKRDLLYDALHLMPSRHSSLVSFFVCQSLGVQAKLWSQDENHVTLTAQRMKYSIKDFFSKCDPIAGNCGFGHIYWRNP